MKTLRNVIIVIAFLLGLLNPGVGLVTLIVAYWIHDFGKGHEEARENYEQWNNYGGPPFYMRILWFFNQMFIFGFAVLMIILVLFAIWLTVTTELEGVF